MRNFGWRSARIEKRIMLEELLGIKYPIIQAPMAGADSAKFVAAACNAGILGSIGAQYRTPQQIRDVITEVRTLTDRPFAVNLFALPSQTVPNAAQIEASRKQLHSYYQRFGVTPPTDEVVQSSIDPDEQLLAVLDSGVAVFSFTLGIPSPEWLRRLKEKSIKIIGTATNVAEARALHDAGVDAIVAQGSEAGGHRGTFIGSFEDSMIGSISLIPQMVDAVNIPVIAAGGIMDGRGIAAAFALGAAGVQLGTAFLTVNESPTHQNYKIAVQGHQADQTTITRVFSGGAARGINNKYIKENADKPLLPFPYHNALTRGFRKVANETGEIEYTNLWCGQSGKLARQISTSELVHHLVDETQAIINDLAQRHSLKR